MVVVVLEGQAVQIRCLIQTLLLVVVAVEVPPLHKTLLMVVLVVVVAVEQILLGRLEMATRHLQTHRKETMEEPQQRGALKVLVVVVEHLLLVVTAAQTLAVMVVQELLHLLRVQV
jgi:hypothetical protein